MSEDSSSIKWLQEIEDIKERSIDPLSEELLRRFNGAVAWQGSERVNGKSLRLVLQECWEQQNGVLSCEDQKAAEALGVDAVINITALKTGIANAYLSEALTSSDATLPWVIQPTPRPDLSPIAKEEVLQEVKSQFFTTGYENPVQLVDHIKMLKALSHRREQEKADKAAQEMMYLIEDQCAEGGFARAMTDFLQYFPVYPFAVFAGPYVTRAPRLTWGKRKPRFATEVFPTFRSISPFDFCYSPDSPDTQRGTCVFTRTLWTRRELLDAAKLPSYFTDNILYVLEKADANPDFNLEWLSRAPDSPKRDISLWASNVSPLEVLTHYGVMSGRELSKYKVTGLKDTEFYNCEISMAGYRVIQVKVMSDPKMQIRPVYTASFYRTGGDRICGDGIAQRLRDVERAYLASLRYLMRNAANASAPLCEADYRRLAKYMSDEDLGSVVPGMMYLADSEGANNRPALTFYNVPSNLQGYTQLMELFMQLADRVTNIPASLHGEAVGSGAMRTFRGMAQLQGNATKALHAAVANISTGVFTPLGENLYNLNMLYSDDVAIKGDAQIMTKGAEGILAKEIERQNAQEIIQMIAQAGAQIAQAGGLNITPVLGWSLKKLFGAMNIPEDVIEQMDMPTPQMLAQAQQQAMAQQGNGANPNSNPAPPDQGGAAMDVAAPGEAS